MPMSPYGTARVDAEQGALVDAVTGSVEGERARRLGGASWHNYAVGVDLGERYLLTGKDGFGRRMPRREAGSMLAVVAILSESHGYKRAYHLRKDGTRRRVFSRG